MSRRKARPIFCHDGFVLRVVKTLADGTELMYCDQRQSIGCNASARRVNGEIILRKAHNGHDADNDVASAKLTRHHIKQIASTSTVSPKQLMNDLQSTYGSLALAGSRESITKMIHRVRQPKPDASTSSDGTTEIDDQLYNLVNNLAKKEPNSISCDEHQFSTSFEELIKLIKPDESDHGDISNTPEPTFFQDTFQNQSINPPRSFFTDLIEAVRETVQQEMQSVASSFQPSNSDQLYKKSSDNVHNSMNNFLMSMANLANHTSSFDIKLRIKSVIEKFENNEHDFNIEDMLSDILCQLESKLAK